MFYYKPEFYDVQLKNGATIVIQADTINDYGSRIQFVLEGRGVALLIMENVCSIQLRTTFEKPKTESKLGYPNVCKS